MDLHHIAEIVESKCGLTLNNRILVGVSGGPDSLCLLHSLYKLEIPLIIAHFNHKIRPSADAEAEYVKELANRYKLLFILKECDIKSLAEKRKASLEEVAREERYRFFFRNAEVYQASAVAVGHTADDQAETILMHILRGSGLKGLTGMQYKSLTKYHSTIQLIRPLLGIWHMQTVAYCEQNLLIPCFDESNLDNTYFRNKVRNMIIPNLVKINPNIKERLLSMSEILREDFYLIEKLSEKAFRECVVKEEKECLILSSKRLLRREVAIQRLVLRKALEHIFSSMEDVDFRSIELLRNFLYRPTQLKHMEFKRGLQIYLEKDNVILTFKDYPPLDLNFPQMDLSQPLQINYSGRTKLPDGWVIDCQSVPVPKRIKDGEKTGKHFNTILDFDKISDYLFVRNIKPGDRFHPLGMGGKSKKVSDFWIDKKIPKNARAKWPLVFSGNQLIWIPGFQPAHFCRITKNTQKAIRIEMKKKIRA